MWHSILCLRLQQFQGKMDAWLKVPAKKICVIKVPPPTIDFQILKAKFSSDQMVQTCVMTEVLHISKCVICMFANVWLFLSLSNFLSSNLKHFLWFSFFGHKNKKQDGYSISTLEKKVQSQVRKILSKGQVELFMRLLKRINKKWPQQQE